MHSLKFLCLSGCLALLVFCSQNSEGRKCTRKNWSCPNTTISYDVTNPVIVRAAQRQFVEDVAKSELISKSLSPKGKEFVQNLADLVYTDSPSFLKAIYGFNIYVLDLLANAKDSPSLCLAARNINSSVIWKETQDGNATVAALREVGANIINLCVSLQTITLQEAGCEELPAPVTISTTRCHGRGTIYNINEALEYFGDYLPCSVYAAVHALYASPDYKDNLLASSFVLALTPEYQCLLHDAELNLILELYYMYLHNDVSVCCCNKRRARFDKLCTAVNGTTNVNIENILQEVYLVQECAPELKDNSTSPDHHT